MTPHKSGLAGALPFAVSFLALPLLALGAVRGGLWLALVPVYGWYIFPVLDRIVGKDPGGLDPDTPDAAIYWHRAVTRIWLPIQLVMIYGSIWYATRPGHLDTGELIALFAGVGVLSGSIGIVFAHELMHQPGRGDRWLGDLLLASTLYSHFRSEHLIVHHTHVATPRDAVTARYNEGFWWFFVRVLPGCFVSALMAEAERLTKHGRSAWSLSNPFWRYAGLQAGFAALALAIGGGPGLALFAWQALIAVFQLELVNYVEHYGLTRQRLDSGRFEPVQPRHSWNADQIMSNWYLINLQRHSDHHYKPARPYPLLQSYSPDEAPQLPASYAVMTLLAVVPPLFRRVMNPRVRAWRRRHYPGISDWTLSA